MIDRVARAESQKLAARRFAARPSVPATTWVSLGPTDAPQEINYYKIDAVDSGRPNNIVVDPRDANVVYIAASGGGVWKTFDFTRGRIRRGPDDGYAAEPRGRRARD